MVDERISFVDQWQMITYGNGLWVIINECSNDCLVSSNGIEWDIVHLNAEDTWESIIFRDDQFVIIGTYGFAYSRNGLDWSYVSIPSEDGIEYDQYDEYRSADFVFRVECMIRSHTNLDTIFPNELIMVGRSEKGYLAVSSNSCACSVDGIDWNIARTMYGDWLSMCNGNGTWVIVGKDSRCLVGNDRVWHVGDMISADVWSSIHYGDGKYIALTSDGKTGAMSYDGLLWRKIGFPNDWLKI